MSNSVGGCDHVEESTSKKRSRERSEVWIHFDKTPDNKNAICKYCGTSMVAESTKGTSHLKRHIKVCKKRQQDVDQPVTMGIRGEVRKFGWTNKRNWEVEVMKAIIADVPFAPSDNKKVYSRLMGSKDLDKEIGLYYEQEKEKLANEFKHLTSRVCFSYEIIKELKLNYISITAHFINEDFNLVNKLIGLKKLTNISESTSVLHTIVKCISDWELGDKIFSFTGKDHSEYVRSLKEDFSPIMSLDGPYFHLPCYQKGSITNFYFGSPFQNRSFYCKENKIIVVACALDPRYKLRFLNYYSENIAEKEFNKEYTNEICEFLENFFGEYKRKTTEFANPQEGCTSNSANLNPKSELEEYLNDTLVDLDGASFNLLGWWKHNRLRYPVLSKMARDVLAIPTCVFSIKGNMISHLRAFKGVSPQLVESVICSKDWIITNVQSVPESNN